MRYGRFLLLCMTASVATRTRAQTPVDPLPPAIAQAESAVPQLVLVDQRYAAAQTACQDQSSSVKDKVAALSTPVDELRAKVDAVRTALALSAAARDSATQAIEQSVSSTEKLNYANDGGALKGKLDAGALSSAKVPVNAGLDAMGVQLGVCQSQSIDALATSQNLSSDAQTAGLAAASSDDCPGALSSFRAELATLDATVKPVGLKCVSMRNTLDQHILDADDTPGQRTVRGKADKMATLAADNYGGAEQKLFLSQAPLPAQASEFADQVVVPVNASTRALVTRGPASLGIENGVTIAGRVYSRNLLQAYDWDSGAELSLWSRARSVVRSRVSAQTQWMEIQEKRRRAMVSH